MIVLLALLDIVLEFDRGIGGELGQLGRKILQKKFESHNKAWLEAVQEEYAHHAYGGYGGGMSSHAVMADDRFFSEQQVVVCCCCFPAVYSAVMSLLLFWFHTILLTLSTFSSSCSNTARPSGRWTRTDTHPR